MSAPRLCVGCRHPVGKHSHIVPHPCKVERCGCGAYEKTAA